MGAEIVAAALGLGAVNHANGTFEPRLVQGQRKLGMAGEVNQKVAQASGMKLGFVALRQSRAHRFALGRAVPIRGGRHRAVVGAKAHEQGLAPKALAHQLPQIEFAARMHGGGAGVAQVRVVGPDHHLGRAGGLVKVAHKRQQRVHHVLVTQVPGRCFGPKHAAVVLLGVFDHGGVLGGAKGGV